MSVNEHKFPIWKKKMDEQFLSDNSTDILFKLASEVKWTVYNKLHVGNYTSSKVYHDKVSYVTVLHVNSQECPFRLVLKQK